MKIEEIYELEPRLEQIVNDICDVLNFPYYHGIPTLEGLIEAAFSCGELSEAKRQLEVQNGSRISRD